MEEVMAISRRQGVFVLLLYGESREVKSALALAVLLAIPEVEDSPGHSYDGS